MIKQDLFVPYREYPWYLISRDGYLVNTETGEVLFGSVKKTGYIEVCVRESDGTPHYKLMHRLVAEAFCERKGTEDEVNHINGDKRDNRSDNLEWVSHAANLRHAFETGLRKDDVSPRHVIATSMETGEQQEFQSIYKAARFMRISQGNICMCCKGRRPYAGGYFWRYAEDKRGCKSMKVTLSCPHAEYRDGMKIYCKKAGGWCGHAFFKRCKGWWALTPQADKCPLRKEKD